MSKSEKYDTKNWTKCSTNLGSLQNELKIARLQIESLKNELDDAGRKQWVTNKMQELENQNAILIEALKMIADSDVTYYERVNKLGVRVPPYFEIAFEALKKVRVE